MTLALLFTLQLVDGEVVQLAGDMKFTEGPAADANGHVYFTDIPNERILKWDGRALTVWREKSGRANGLFFDTDGTLLVCEGGSRALTRLTADQKRTVLADSYGGKKLNSPNDLCLHPKGGVYFTDPRYGKRDDLEQDKEAVYFLREKVVRVVDDLVRPNGIIATKDRLYIADNGAKKVYSYAMKDDGALADRKLFCEVQCDGMTLDEKGNVYTTTGKGIEIFAPDGKALGVIAVPEHPSNCTFGGTTLYITARTSLYAVKMKVKGY